MVPQIVEANVTIPFLYFFETTKTVTKTVMFPVINSPDIRVAFTIVGLTVATAITVFLYIVKAIFKAEVRICQRLLLRHIEKPVPGRTRHLEVGIQYSFRTDLWRVRYQQA